MNLPNKITVGRIVLAILIMVLLIVPWYDLQVSFPTFQIGGRLVLNTKYIIAGVLFIIASVTDFIDGYLARSRNLVTDFGKVMDAIADKILVNGILIILAYDGFIHVAVPVIIILRDIFVDSFKMVSGNHGKVVAASFWGKAKTMCMMVGITLTLFYNLPFELFNFNFSGLLILIATVLSVVSGCQYYFSCKQFLKEK